MFAKNCWYVALERAAVPSGKPVAVTVAGEEIVLYRDRGNALVAMADLCPHRLAPLSLGRIEGDDIRCMYHGIRFSPEGQCLEVPGQDKIPDNFCVRRYTVFESFQWIWVWIGDQNRADPALVPDRHFHDPELFHVRTGSMPFAANYELFNDNTCDLSHVAYVHETTFKLIGGDDWSESQPVLTRGDRSVQVDRWIENIRMPQVPDAAVDFSSRFEHSVPGVFVMDLQAHPAGTAKKLDYGDPPAEMKPLYQSATIQTMRPISETTSHFYFSLMCPRWLPESVVEADFAFALTGFSEDKVMIEAQQHVISLNPDEPLRMTMHDKAGAHVRKLIRDTNKISAEV